MTMTVWQSVVMIGAVVLGTVLTRFLPFWLFPEGKRPPKFVLYLGRVLPGAAIGMLVVYCLKDAVFTAWHGLPELLAMENCRYDNAPLRPWFDKLAEVVRKDAHN